MAETIDLFVPLGDLDQPLAPQVERALGWSAGSAGELRVVRRSLDARKGRPLGERLRVAVARRGEALAPATPARPPSRWPAGRAAPRVVVVGSGPAGTWAALRLAEAGVPVDHPRAGQAGAAASPRPGAGHARRAGAALELLLRRRGRRDLLRRQALRAREGSRRGRRGDRRSGPLRRAGRDRGRRASARRLESAAARARRAARAPRRARRRAPLRDGGHRPARRGGAGPRRARRRRRDPRRRRGAGGGALGARRLRAGRRRRGHRARAQADRRRRPHRAPAAAHRSRFSTAPRPATPSCRRRSTS